LAAAASTVEKTVDAVVPASQVAAIARRREVRYATVDAIEGRAARSSKAEPGWFCVWGVVAVQIEGRVNGMVSLEDRLVLVKAADEEGAKRRLERMWTRYAEPYMNLHGGLVRWQLISISDVYPLCGETLDPRGTEVYSRLRTVRMRPEFRWRPEKGTTRHKRAPK